MKKRQRRDGAAATSGADRQKRWRQRSKSGDMAVQIVVSRRVRDVLVEARWLPEWSEDDRQTVLETVQKLIDGIEPVTRNGSG